ncbi:hypothetical protein HZS_4672, partial [Henneguya salminicola]
MNALFLLLIKALAAGKTHLACNHQLIHDCNPITTKLSCAIKSRKGEGCIAKWFEVSIMENKTEIIMGNKFEILHQTNFYSQDTIHQFILKFKSNASNRNVYLLEVKNLNEPEQLIMSIYFYRNDSKNLPHVLSSRKQSNTEIHTNSFKIYNLLLSRQ